MSNEDILVSKNRFPMIHNNPNENDLISSTISEDSHTPLSETVTTLASNVYKELERIIKKFGENSVKDLMPVMISTLESLDNALHERDVGKLENDSLKEQNEQLFQQYEREKSFHKEYQQRYLQVEDHLEEVKRENEEKLQSLESIVKIFEIKARNASDHIGRLEEKENDMKQEYKRLHERYCELFKVHCDYMERTKILYGSDQIMTKNLPLTDEKDLTPSELESSDGKHTQTESLTSNDVAVNTAKLTMIDEISLKEFTTGLLSKLRSLNVLSDTFDERQFFVNEDDFDQTNPTIDPNVSDDEDDFSVDDTKNSEAFDKEIRNENMDNEDLFVRQSFYGMTKEVSNLIKENNELLETKNALNVLKDDLLVKIEELSNEQEILREQVDSLQTVRTRLQTKITEVEEELRKTREEFEKKKEEEENVPTADRKRFTRVEMQRVLLERNQYKQRLFELEEAIHRHDALRALKQEQNASSSSLLHEHFSEQIFHKRRPIFSKLFSGLFGSTTKEASPKRSVTTTHVKQSITTDQIAPQNTENSTTTDENNRMEINGWSLSSNASTSVPNPVYCRPIFNTNDKTQIWCAIGIDLNGLTPDTDQTSMDQLNKQLIESYHQMIDEQYLKLSSILWIAAKSNDTAIITILDSNKPEQIIDKFPLGNAIIYSMGSIPGISTSDYPILNEIVKTNSDVKITACTPDSLSTNGNRSTTIKSSDLSNSEQEKKMKYPTVWLGSSDGWLYIHSAIGEHRTTIAKVWLHHAIYSIVHNNGRVFVSLANEKIVVFHRNSDGIWDLRNVHLIQTGKTRESVRCLINVGKNIWCGIANRVYVIDVQTLEICKQFQVHSRPEHSVQYMTWSSQGVWLSIRLSSTLQLYHTETFEFLQDFDIQPHVEKMITTEKTGLYFVHISALTIACRRLWIGTGNGIVISIPLVESDSSNYIPLCNLSNAQLSFHGYRDAVKFFVAVPGQSTSKVNDDDDETNIQTRQSQSSFEDILVVSGGDGYNDFHERNTTTIESNEEMIESIRHVSYLIVWHLGSNSN